MYRSSSPKETVKKKKKVAINWDKPWKRDALQQVYIKNSCLFLLVYDAETNDSHKEGME
jgi:hypothetical protein